MMLRARHEHPSQSFGPPPLAMPSVQRKGDIEIVLDLSRLLSRTLHRSPTGVDRVEMAYARTLMRRIPDRLAFSAVHPTGLYGRLPWAEVERFLDVTATRWESPGRDESPATARRFGLAQGWSLRPRSVPSATGPRILLQASPHHLDRQRTVAAKLAREHARFVCLVHDLIPISHPEYARPSGSERHQRRMCTIQTYADGILTNSQATLDALNSRSTPGFGDRPVRVAHLGIDPHRAPVGETAWPGAGYFVCIATIEPRKNHLLLLNVWRSLAEALGPNHTPQLILVGRRGWENENILDMLDRCPSLKGIVHELPRLHDADLRPLLRDARALLMPSFAEGFGLPIAEALAVGVPVLASDLPAHREAGSGAPEYFDPIDGAAWRSAILDYFAPASRRRTAQLARIAEWRPATWENHIDTALSLIEEVARC